MGTAKTYEAARASAQADANTFGRLYRLRYNKLFKEYYWGMVPQLRHQFGSDRDGELVQPEDHEAAVRARGLGGETTSDPETAFHRAKGSL